MFRLVHFIPQNMVLFMVVKRLFRLLLFKIINKNKPVQIADVAALLKEEVKNAPVAQSDRATAF